MQWKTRIHDGILSQYFEYGDPENPAIVCFHGLAGSGIYTYGELAPLLQGRYRLIVFDSPGHGGTEAFESKSGYRFSNLAEWFHGAVGTILSEPYFIMGHSWGADVALHFARHFPGNIRGLILLDGAFTFPQNQPEMTKENALAGWADYMENAVYDTWQDVANEYRNFTSRWNARIEQSTKSIFHRQADRRYRLIVSENTILPILEAFFEEPFSEAYSYVNVPTLLIHAELPEELTAAREQGIAQMTSEIADVSICPIPGTGHMLQWDAPEKVAAHIEAWMLQKALL
ncbi:alpha/beta fold hydrolase [Planococcus sp. FY231025]|uniref:alpha/beta fold hydrolase n=1 Tax=Planococcus sp. FY231025 TaxID=3455699 RepID=UPI003F92CB3D